MRSNRQAGAFVGSDSADVQGFLGAIQAGATQAGNTAQGNLRPGGAGGGNANRGGANRGGRNQVDIRLHTVIYELGDEMRNAMTGLRASVVPPQAALKVGQHLLAAARTFSEVGPGEAFWYANSNGLVEVAVNRGRACDVLQLEVGSTFSIAA